MFCNSMFPPSEGVTGKVLNIDISPHQKLSQPVTVLFFQHLLCQFHNSSNNKQGARVGIKSQRGLANRAGLKAPHDSVTFPWDHKNPINLGYIHIKPSCYFI